MAASCSGVINEGIHSSGGISGQPVPVTCVGESPAVLILAQQAAEGVSVLVQVHI